jgi:hypothetical protein
MGTSTNRPKPKSGQSAARNGNSKSGGTQQKADGAQPVARTTTNANDAKAATKPAGAKTMSKLPPPPPPTKRDQKREGRREELNRRIEERRQQREREQRSRRIKKWSMIGVPTAVVVIVVGIILYNTLFGPQVAPYFKGDPIDGITCGLEQSQTHYHAHLQIYINGAQYPIPGDVGRQSATGCFYWLHVHSDPGDEGVIHVEAPSNQNFTLKQFFDIWGQQLSATNLMGHQVDAKHKLTVYVYNPDQQPTDSSQPFTVTPPNNLTPYTGDPTKITLKPHELIVLEYNSSVPPPPWTFLASE